MIDALLTKRGVKMAGYWPSSTRRSRGPQKRKKRTRPIPSYLYRRSLVIKGFILEQKDFALLRIKNDLLFREPGFMAYCVCGTLDHDNRLCSLCFECLLPLFCDSIANIVQKNVSFEGPFHAMLNLRGIKVRNPKWARWAHLACSGSQSERKIRLILPTGAAGDIVNIGIHTSRHITSRMQRVFGFNPCQVFLRRTWSTFLLMCNFLKCCFSDVAKK